MRRVKGSIAPGGTLSLVHGIGGLGESAAGAFGGLATATGARVEAKLVERDRYEALIGAARPALDRLRARKAELLNRR